MVIRFTTTCVTCVASWALLGGCGPHPTDHTRFRFAGPGPLALFDEKVSTPREESADRPPAQPLVRVRVSQFQMGMMVHLTVWAQSDEKGRQACKAAFRRIREVNLQMSDYEPTSELSRLCRQAGRGPVPVGAELFEVLAAARRLAELTDGLYDPTAGPLVRIWRNARKTQVLPDAEAQTAARELVGYQQLLLDAAHQTVQLKQPGMQLDLGSIAKGYAGDQALRALRRQGITRAAFEAGGDMVLGDPPPDADGWTIELPHPKATTQRWANCAVSVSGDTVQYLQIDGRHFSHVIDPRTGMGVESRRMCIVVAANGMNSDPLATLGTLMEVDQYQRLLQRNFPTVQAELLPAPTRDPRRPPHIPPP